MVAYRDGVPRLDSLVSPNDPLYLMAPSTTPAPWHDRALFRHLPDLDSTYTVQIDGKAETVEVRYSMVKNKPDAIGENRRALPGNTPYGQHARRNMGVSIVREGREIVLDDNCVDTALGGGAYPLNRWWGCEVRFNAGLDDLFGVDHNKQMVAHFSQLLKYATLSRAELLLEAEDELDSQADPLAKIAVDIRRNISSLMRQIAQMFRRRNPVPGPRNGKLTPTEQAEKTATDATEESLRNQATSITATDEDFVNTAPSEKEAAITKTYVEAGYDVAQAKEEAALIVNSGNRYRFMDGNLPGHYVFLAEPVGGVLIVKLNVNHRFHQYLDSLEADVEANGNEASETAAIGLRLAILALARLDDEFTDRDAKLRFQENCERWGRMLDRIITEEATHVSE